MTTPKLGRDVVFDYLKEARVEYVFGVPGTQEIPLIDATTIPENGIEYIPCLHENIAMGAAMGYARASGRPGVALVHITPGAANIVGNLFDAYTSNIPVLVICGQQHSDVLIQEPLLGSDLVRTAGQYAKWAHEVRDADELPIVLQRAFKELSVPPFRPVFISIPWDFLIEAPTLQEPARSTRIAHRAIGDPAGVAAAVERLATAKKPVLLLGDGVGEARAWPEIEQLANLLGAAVYSEFQSSRMNYPNDLPHWQGELAPIQDGIHLQLQGFDTAFVIGSSCQAQVTVFRWEKGPILPAELSQVVLHNDPWEIGKNSYAEVGVLGDIKQTLPLIISGIAAHANFGKAAAKKRNDQLLALGAQREESFAEKSAEFRSAAAATTIPGYQVPLVLADVQKTLDKPITILNEEFAIGATIQKAIHYDEPDAYFCTSGGALGFSLPASIGFSLALKQERFVVTIVGDGSALFHTNSWWTTAKFELPVLYLVVNNHEYETLQTGLGLIGKIYGWQPTNPAWYLTLGDPPQDFAKIAGTFAIDGEVVKKANKLRPAIERGFKAIANGKPYIIDIRTDPDAPNTPPTVDMRLAQLPGADPELVGKIGEIGPP